MGLDQVDQSLVITFRETAIFSSSEPSNFVKSCFLRSLINFAAKNFLNSTQTFDQLIFKSSLVLILLVKFGTFFLNGFRTKKFHFEELSAKNIKYNIGL